MSQTTNEMVSVTFLLLVWAHSSTSRVDTWLMLNQHTSGHDFWTSTISLNHTFVVYVKKITLNVAMPPFFCLFFCNVLLALVKLWLIRQTEKCFPRLQHSCEAHCSAMKPPSHILSADVNADYVLRHSDPPLSNFTWRDDWWPSGCGS